MTLTPARRRVEPSVAARTVDVTQVYGSGDIAARALGPSTRGVA